MMDNDRNRYTSGGKAQSRVNMVLEYDMTSRTREIRLLEEKKILEKETAAKMLSRERQKHGNARVLTCPVESSMLCNTPKMRD